MAGYANWSPEFNRVNRDMSALFDAVNSAWREVEIVRNEVGVLQNNLDTTHSQLAELKEAFDRYVTQAERATAVQRAEIKLGNLKSELDRHFGHYGVVRRASVGVLQAFDVANVKDDVVSHVSEELMIQSPGYWLAPALVALAAWSRDDKGVADKSVAEAYKRNPEKTSLFFTLVLRRMGRDDAALRWLAHYLKNQNSAHLTREFAVILEAISQGAFGPRGAELATKQLRVWNDNLRRNEEIVQTQVDEWEDELRANAAVLADDEYPALRAVSPDFETVKSMLENASTLGRTREKYERVRNSDYSMPSAMADVLDDLLEQLVSEYDEEELPLRRDVAFNEAVIDSDGDQRRSDELARQYQSVFEETVDAVTLQTQTAIRPEAFGVSGRTQQAAVGGGIGDLRQALRNFTRDYRAAAVEDVVISLGADHNTQARAHNFVGHESRTSEPEDQVLSRLEDEWARTFAPYIQSQRFKASTFFKPTLLVAIALFVGFSVSRFTGFLALLACAWLVFQIYSGVREANAAVKQAELERSQAFESSRLTLLEARAEFTDALFEFKELENEEDGLNTLLNGWPTPEHSSTY